ncbi:hypothetical protein E8A74_15270 [Polyangium fumosum]|uniref:Uncharacterized protein n=1 Tax=Polyangium fumosum TaxID=889272 RepID=A0A4U1JDP1_9BACT|nr:hypothetical protein E8A74_15270 [Polyangium fumosum]
MPTHRSPPPPWPPWPPAPPEPARMIPPSPPSPPEPPVPPVPPLPEGVPEVVGCCASPPQPAERSASSGSAVRRKELDRRMIEQDIGTTPPRKSRKGRVPHDAAPSLHGTGTMLIQFSIVYSSCCPASIVTLPSFTSTTTDATR